MIHIKGNLEESLKGITRGKQFQKRNKRGEQNESYSDVTHRYGTFTAEHSTLPVNSNFSILSNADRT